MSMLQISPTELQTDTALSINHGGSQVFQCASSHAVHRQWEPGWGKETSALEVNIHLAAWVKTWAIEKNEDGEHAFSF